MITMKKRKPIKRWGRIGKIKAEQSRAARDLYFSRYGELDLDGNLCAPCQLCQGPMFTPGCDIHHKFRRQHNVNDPIFLVALHRWCHAFVHQKRERENFLASEACDQVGCNQGGVIRLPAEMGREWLESTLKKF